MKIRLPLCKKPPMVANQFFALPLSIIFTQPQQYEDWFYNEFTQLYSLIAAPTNEMQIKLYSDLNDGLFAPLDSIQIPYTSFHVGEDIAQFYRILLKNGYYIRTFCNVKFLTPLHIQTDFFHDFMIFGFDDTTGLFDIRTYVDGHLRDVQVSFEEMNQGHLHTSPSDGINQFITTYQLNNIPNESVLDCFSWRLMDYLGGINPAHREQMINYGFDPCCWGIRIYDLFERFFELSSEGTGVYISQNNWYTLYEHKQHIQQQCRHFSKKGLIRYSDTLDQEMNEICDTALRCIFLRMKAELHGGYHTQKEIPALQRHIRLLKEQELSTYTKLCRLNGWYMERS